MRRPVSAVIVAAGAAFLAMAPAGVDAHTASPSTARQPALVAQASMPVTLTVAATQHLVATTATLVSHNPVSLTALINQIVASSGGTAGVTLVELGGATPIAWSLNGSGVFTAASTYKLAALMMEAQNIASGATDPNGVVCYEDSDYEAGWYDDYSAGACFTRYELAWRAGQDSDNTAGHMLVRDLGGADALNAWAAANGATHSVFFTDNTSTSDDLAVLWTAEAKGRLGGTAAQSWLYPLLTDTATEAGIPSGVASRSTVVHKTGAIDAVENDAALIVSGPNGAYILTVMTDGLGGDAGWQLIASISAEVWTFEAARAAL
ncbi:MAG TPA: serine hydrolase [Candidatus Sulfotelmatobacter sp.]|nr:serine hydrolase [Candidatus Sulfotelmatobacter sp.]